MATSPQPTDAAFTGFLKDSQMAIVDESTGTRIALATMLTELGVPLEKVLLLSTFEEAEKVIATKKPRVIFSDYKIGKRFGLDLLQMQRSALPDSLFILVTANASQAVVARAAEEDVDTFILKPYTSEGLKNSLTHSFLNKIKPSDYLQHIALGKDALSKGKLEESLGHLKKALELDSSPTLACFYSGLAEKKRTRVPEAKENYQKGLGYNAIHFKCLQGLYKLLHDDEKDLDRAYGILKRLHEHFPANPTRLQEAVKLAIQTENYADILGYFLVYKELDPRSDVLTKHFGAGLCVSGKYFLKKDKKDKALEAFGFAAECAGENPQILRYIVETLVENSLLDKALVFVKKFPAWSKETNDYKISEFLISGASETPQSILKKGVALLDQGVESPMVFKEVIKLQARLGKKEELDYWVESAILKYKNQEAEFKLLAVPTSEKRRT